MKKDQIITKLKEGYKPYVFIQPNKQYSGVKLVTRLQNPNSNIIYDIYYNHAKEFLSASQINFIDLYNEVKTYQFRDKVELNIKKQKLTATREDFEKIIMLGAINRKEYLTANND
jgi:exonuclease III